VDLFAGLSVLPRGVGFGVSRTYLVVGHIFFDDHFDMREKVIFEVWYDKNALEGTGLGGCSSAEGKLEQVREGP
jgi:pantoate kinase